MRYFECSSFKRIWPIGIIAFFPFPPSHLTAIKRKAPLRVLLRCARRWSRRSSQIWRVDIVCSLFYKNLFFPRSWQLRNGRRLRVWLRCARRWSSKFCRIWQTTLLLPILSALKMRGRTIRSSCTKRSLQHTATHTATNTATHTATHERTYYKEQLHEEVTATHCNKHLNKHCNTHCNTHCNANCNTWEDVL